VKPALLKVAVVAIWLAVGFGTGWHAEAFATRGIVRAVRGELYRAMDMAQSQCTCAAAGQRAAAKRRVR
jgi:hypothetical protein